MEFENELKKKSEFWFKRLSKNNKHTHLCKVVNKSQPVIAQFVFDLKSCLKLFFF